MLGSNLYETDFKFILSYKFFKSCLLSLFRKKIESKSRTPVRGKKGKRKNKYMSYFERRVSFSFCKAFNWSLWDDWRLLISCRKPWAMSSSVASFRCRIFDSNDSLAVTSCKKELRENVKCITEYKSKKRI